MHVADRQLDLKRFCEQYLKDEKCLTWRVIFAKILSRSILLPRCTICLEKPTVAFLQTCNSHPKEPIFASGAYIGIYKCCGKHVIRTAYENHAKEVDRVQ